MWFWGGEKVDDEIRRRFEADVTAAAEGRLARWEETPKGALALIVLLDQFSLNLYREQPKSYLQSELAIPIAERAIQRGWEWVYTPLERLFLYLPFEHGERLDHQERSVSLFTAMAKTTPPSFKELADGVLDYAVHHWRVVKRFGRFPDRNEVFGRENTPEEEKFLASDEAPF